MNGRAMARCLAGLVLAATAASCTTYTNSGAYAPSGAAAQEMQQRAARERAEEERRRLLGRIDGLELQCRDLQDEIAALRTAQHGSQQARQALQAQVDGFTAQIAALNQAREQDRQAIISQLTKNMEKALSQYRRPAAPAPAADGFGYEHIVEPGQTLSQIAAFYKVSQQAIIKANAMKNPNELQIGQRLFIPEP